MKIVAALAGIRRLGVETAPLIYYVENHPVYADKMDAIFKYMEAAGIHAYCSTITLTETLTKPIEAGDKSLETAYRDLLTGTDYIFLMPVTEQVAEGAARLRARYHLKTPDALHLAAAIETDCDAFLTNDLSLRRVAELRVLVLDDLELDTPPTT